MLKIFESLHLRSASMGVWHPKCLFLGRLPSEKTLHNLKYFMNTSSSQSRLPSGLEQWHVSTFQPIMKNAAYTTAKAVIVLLQGRVHSRDFLFPVRD
jgi:hypothetical protein